jgi:methyl-accepting chemotaxis protein
MSQAQQITAKLVQLVQQIAEFSQQQALMSRELQLSVTKLNRGSEATVLAISHQTHSTQSLVASAHRLIGAVSQFTLPKLA